MPSKRITTFRSASQPVIAGALETASEVAGSLGEVYDAFLEEAEKPIDWSLLQKLVSRRLENKGLRLAELDARLEVGRSGDKQLRRDRDRLVATLRSELRSARFLLDESLGRDGALGLVRWRHFSQVLPPELVPVARETAASLRSSPLLAKSLHPAAAAGPAPDALPEPAALADALERRALELEQLLGQLAPKRKRETFEVGEKDQEWQEAYGALLRSQDLLYGLYRAAGKDHLAYRLRPKTRKKAGPAEEPNAPPKVPALPSLP